MGENDGSMDDEDEDEVDSHDDMNPANLFDEVSLSMCLVMLTFTCSHFLKSLLKLRMPTLDAKVITCLLLPITLFIYILGVDPTATHNACAYQSRSAHSRSSSASRFQSVAPPTTSGDEDMNFYEDEEEDEPAPPQHQVSVSEVCFTFFFYQDYVLRLFSNCRDVIKLSTRSSNPR